MSDGLAARHDDAVVPLTAEEWAAAVLSEWVDEALSLDVSGPNHLDEEHAHV